MEDSEQGCSHILQDGEGYAKRWRKPGIDCCMGSRKEESDWAWELLKGEVLQEHGTAFAAFLADTNHHITLKL